MHAGVKNSGKSVTEILINENHMKLFDGCGRHEEHRHHAADLFRAAAVVAAGLAPGARRMAVQPPGIARRGDVAVVIGRSGEQEIAAYDLSEAGNTITNEWLSCLGARLPRIVV